MTDNVPDLKFNSIKALKGRNAFAELQKSKIKFKLNSIFCIAYNLQTETIADDTFYYVVSVSKKISKKAVIRNRIKRLLRVAIRQHSELISELKANNQINVIYFSWQVSIKKKYDVSLDEIASNVKLILSKLSKSNK